MKKINTLAAVIALAGVGLAGCDSPAEERAEDRADTIEAKGEATADALEERADAVRDQADAKADQVEEKAENATPPQ